MIIKRITVAQYERVLVWKSKRFDGVLEPGVHWIVTPLDQVELQTYDLDVPEFEHPRVDLLLKEERGTMEKYFYIVELADSEAGLVYKNGKLAGVLAPGKRQLYWLGSLDVRVERVDIAASMEVPAPAAKLLARASQSLAAQAQDAIMVVEVADTSMGLLIVDGEFNRVLEPGVHVFWKFHRVLKAEFVDRRVQTMEVSGHEMLTRDKVSLRTNLTALWQVVDAVKARGELQNFVEFVYKKLQFSLREAIGARTLDEMLGADTDIDREIATVARRGMEQHGLALNSVGIGDVILQT